MSTKRCSVCLLVSGLLCSTAVPQAHAQLAVEDVNANASLMTQVVQGAIAAGDRALDYAQQIAQYVQMVQTYITAVQNTVAIPMDAIARVQGIYMQAQQLVAAAQAITGPDGSVMQRVQMLRGVGQGAQGLYGNAKYGARFWSQQVHKQLDDNAKLLGLEAERKQLNDAVLGTAQTTGNVAGGQMQALMASNQLAAATAMQLQQTNAHLVQALQYQMEKDAREASKEEAFSQYADGRQFELGLGQGF